MIVRLLRIINTKNQLIATALALLDERNRELAAVRRRHQALVNEYRVLRASLSKEAA